MVFRIQIPEQALSIAQESQPLVVVEDRRPASLQVASGQFVFGPHLLENADALAEVLGGFVLLVFGRVDLTEDSVCGPLLDLLA